MSTCKGENKKETVSYLLRYTWTGAAQRDHETGKLKWKITGILPKFRHLRTDISSWSSHPVLPFQAVEINNIFKTINLTYLDAYFRTRGVADREHPCLSSEGV